MQDRTVLRKHARLFDTMAQTVGVDLQEAALIGQVSVDEISDAVLACTGCSNPDHCGHWLQSRPDGAEHPPGYCRNTDLLKRLKPAN